MSGFILGICWRFPEHFYFMFFVAISAYLINQFCVTGTSIILTDAMIEDFKYLSVLDLTQNEFICNSKLILDFYLMAENKNKSLPTKNVVGWNNGTGYVCKNEKGEWKAFQEIVNGGERDEEGYPGGNDGNENDEENLYTLIISMAGSAALITIIAVVAIYYTYDNIWYIKFWLAKQKIKRGTTFHNDQLPLLYDAFVSYSNEDKEWMLKEVATYLEQVKGLKLCLHERDFAAGKPIVENIVQALEQSEACLIILSKDYVDSEWCDFELNCAHHIFSERKSPIAVILTRDVPPEKLSKTMKYILKTQTYIEWKQGQSEDKYRKLMQVIKPRYKMVKNTKY